MNLRARHQRRRKSSGLTRNDPDGIARGGADKPDLAEQNHLTKIELQKRIQRPGVGRRKGNVDEGGIVREISSRKRQRVADDARNNWFYENGIIDIYCFTRVAEKAGESLSPIVSRLLDPVCSCFAGTINEFTRKSKELAEDKVQ